MKIDEKSKYVNAMLSMNKSIDKLTKENQILKNIQDDKPILDVQKIIHIKTRIGDGSNDNPIRYHHSLWNIEGELITEYDS